jgi:hypothetical protein
VVKKDGSDGLEASMQRRGGMSEEVMATGIIHGVTSRFVTRFSAIPPPEVTLFHTELARYDQVERYDNGSVTWKCPRECRGASILGEGNSDAKKTGIKGKTNDSAQDGSRRKTGEVMDRTEEMSPTFLPRKSAINVPHSA